MAAKYHRAAFINVIAEGRSFNEALRYLQEQWNENCELRMSHAELEKAVGSVVTVLTGGAGESQPTDEPWSKELVAICKAALAKAGSHA